MTIIAAIALSLADPDAALIALRAAADAPMPRAPCSMTIAYEGETGGEVSGDVFRFDHTTEEWETLAVTGEPSEDVDRPPPRDHYVQSLQFSKLPIAYVRSDGEKHIFRGEKFKRGTMKVNGRDLSKKISIELHVEAAESGPVITREIVTNIAPIRVPMIAYVPYFKLEKEFVPVPGYGMVTSVVRTDFQLDAMGKNRDTKTTSTYKEYSCPV